MSITLHKGDLAPNIEFGPAVAVDTETMGLNPKRDRLCLVQLSAGDGTAHIVQFQDGQYDAPNLKKLMTDHAVTKIFHFARFDVAVMKEYLNIECTPLYCTKIASRLCRTYTDRHGLKDLAKEILNVHLDKQQQSSNWGAGELTQDQLSYAASDVLYLHKLKDKTEEMLKSLGRLELAQQCFNFLPTRAQLDLEGWNEFDIFQH
ncbi:MAG TPA: ribonuclease D [Alphaproteobacteria bacterium]|nr:ribonuclease D [Alphaproteobacteria bacterium]